MNSRKTKSKALQITMSTVRKEVGYVAMLSEGFRVKRPAHRPGINNSSAVRIDTVFEWPVGTFVENILTREDGKIIVCVHSENRLVEVDPVARRARTFCDLPGAPSGIVESLDRIFVCVGEIGFPGFAVFSVEDDGRSEKRVDVPGALFLNGCALLKESAALAVDSILGKVFRIDLKNRTAAPWLDQELLRKASTEPMLPGVNGIKVFGRYAYFSNSERSLILRAEINDDEAAGKVEVVQEQLVGDDFAFDKNGAIYIATHVHNTLMRLNPDGSREDLGGPDERFAGSTACAFGRTERDKRTLYVTTTGGIIAPLNGKVGKARLLSLALDVSAAETTLAQMNRGEE